MEYKQLKILQTLSKYGIDNEISGNELKKQLLWEKSLDELAEECKILDADRYVDFTQMHSNEFAISITAKGVKLIRKKR